MFCFGYNGNQKIAKITRAVPETARSTIPNPCHRDIALIVLARKTLTKSLSPTRAIILIKFKEELSNFIILVGLMVGKVYAKLHPIIPSGYRDIDLIVLARKTLTKV